MTQAYPLSWPTWVPRTQYRMRAKFGHRAQGATVQVARVALQAELDRLGAAHVTLSTNVELRRDGAPRSDREPGDPGAAVYFMLRKKTICLPCDKWDRVGDNIMAVAKHIEALRGQERWGVGTVEQAFSGYVALPPQNHVDWRGVLQLHRAGAVTGAMVAEAYKRLAFERHPDKGGSDAMMAELNAARDQAMREVGA